METVGGTTLVVVDGPEISEMYVIMTKELVYTNNLTIIYYVTEIH